MVITYKTYKYAGKFDKKITITTGTGEQTETVIQLKGVVDPIPMGIVELSPRKTDVGALKLNQVNSVPILIKNTGDADLTVTRVVSRKFETVYFDGQTSGDLVIAAGQEHRHVLQIKPDTPGRFMDIIMIYSDARNDIGNGYKGVLSGEVLEDGVK